MLDAIEKSSSTKRISKHASKTSQHSLTFYAMFFCKGNSEGITLHYREWLTLLKKVQAGFKACGKNITTQFNILRHVSKIQKLKN